jgi:hypothetical protein
MMQYSQINRKCGVHDNTSSMALHHLEANTKKQNTILHNDAECDNKDDESHITVLFYLELIYYSQAYSPTRVRVFILRMVR